MEAMSTLVVCHSLVPWCLKSASIVALAYPNASVWTVIS